MPRFLKVIGVPEKGLVSDPRSLYGAQARYIGMQAKANIEGLKKGDCYDPVEQVVPDDHEVGNHVRRAVAKGSLVQLDKCDAASMDLAFKPAPSAAKKGG